jgi:hypothetical protein
VFALAGPAMAFGGNASADALGRVCRIFDADPPTNIPHNQMALFSQRLRMAQ